MNCTNLKTCIDTAFQLGENNVIHYPEKMLKVSTTAFKALSYILPLSIAGFSALASLIYPNKVNENYESERESLVHPIKDTTKSSLYVSIPIFAGIFFICLYSIQLMANTDVYLNCVSDFEETTTNLALRCNWNCSFPLSNPPSNCSKIFYLNNYSEVSSWLSFVKDNFITQLAWIGVAHIISSVFIAGNIVKNNMMGDTHIQPLSLKAKAVRVGEIALTLALFLFGLYEILFAALFRFDKQVKTGWDACLNSN